MKWMAIDHDNLRTITAMGDSPSHELCSNYLLNLTTVLML